MGTKSSADPRVYALEEHDISPQSIDAKALYVLEKLRAAGHVAYLVGGSVRDLLLKMTPKDFDISTSARPEEVRALFSRVVLIGRRFRLAHVHFGRKVLEVSTFRAGNIENEEFIKEDNMWGTPEEDAARRDFTMNALFYESQGQKIIDYVGGYEDIRKRRLRAIGQPRLRFKQDPVRMIRCLKFQARFDCDVDIDTERALIACKQDITKSAPARVLEELLRMLESGASRLFFRLMVKNGILQQLLPVVGRALEEGEDHDVYALLKRADQDVKTLRGSEARRSVLLACVIFPFFQQRLKKKFGLSTRPAYLGEIYLEAQCCIDEIFRPFFRFPRRLKIGIAHILTSQYRITPLVRKEGQKVRIPKVPYFSLALQFFHFRCTLCPELEETCRRWEEAFQRGRGPISKHPSRHPAESGDRHQKV